MKHTACRRAIALALILVMLAGILPVTASAAGNPRFDDVRPADWFYSSVETVCGKGLMTGTTTRTFRPELPVTRGMLVTILYRLENYPKTASGSPFADVAAGSYYEKAIRWAAANKIVTGYDAAHFGPDDALTREQLAAILYRYAKAMGYDVSSGLSHTLYADAAEVSGYAQTAVDWAIAEGFLKGKDGWKLCPKAAATRAEMAAILTRFYAYAERQAAARRQALLLAAASRPDEQPDAGLSIRFDRTETVTTQPSVTLTGSYVSDADVASITYTLTGMYSDFLDKTGDVTYADGRWEIADLRIVPDSSAVTLVITDVDGNTAAATGSVYYDLGELVDPELVEIAQDEETGLIFASNILLVYFADDASDADKADVAQFVSGTVVGQDNFMNMQQLMVEPVTLEEASRISDQVEEDFPETVELAMFDLMLSADDDPFNDPWIDENGYGTKGWDDGNPAGTNWGFEAIEATGAWELYGSEFKPIKVGVIEGGFNPNHEDLKGKIKFTSKKDEKKNSKTLGKIETDYDSFEAIAHGDHVSGIISATPNNKKGITGVAPNATIVGCFSGMVSTIVNSVCATVEVGAKVVNLSLGLPAITQKELKKGIGLQRKLSEKQSARIACMSMSRLLAKGYDFVVVQSSGNGVAIIENGKKPYLTGCDAARNGFFATIDRGYQGDLYKVRGTTPVTLDEVLDRIMIVSSAYIQDGEYIRVRSANAGAQVCISAPGSNILSCGTEKNEYRTMGGTSQAAPYVTAVAALTWSADSNLTGAQIKSILCSSYNQWVKDNPNTHEKHTSGEYPLVNARLSVEKALGITHESTRKYHATIVEGPTAEGMTVRSVSAWPSDEYENYIRIALTWDSNPHVQKTFIAAMQADRSFTKSEIDDAIAFYPNLWREEVGEQEEDMPLELHINQHFPWTDAKGYPVYVLLLNMDHEYNVLGYTIVRIEKSKIRPSKPQMLSGLVDG